MVQKLTVLSYCTPKYEKGAARLLASCRRLGLDAHVAVCEFPGTWFSAVMLKPQYIQYGMSQFPASRFLYVDADAMVQHDPSPVFEADFDLAGVRRRRARGRFESRSTFKGAILSGTLFFRPSPSVDRCLADWTERCRSQSSVPCGQAYGSELLLHDCVEAHGLQFHNLPPRSIAIQTHKNRREPADRFVVHFYTPNRRGGDPKVCPLGPPSSPPQGFKGWLQ